TEYTHASETVAGDMRARAEAFGILTERVDGQDVRVVHATAQRLIARARQGDGPAFLVCDTYRYYGHHVGDIQRTYYRSKEEEAFWKTERDPITLLGDWLVEQAIAAADTLDAIRAETQAEVEAGVQFGLNAPYPDASEVDQHVYA